MEHTRVVIQEVSNDMIHTVNTLNMWQRHTPSDVQDALMCSVLLKEVAYAHTRIETHITDLKKRHAGKKKAKKDKTRAMVIDLTSGDEVVEVKSAVMEEPVVDEEPVVKDELVVKEPINE